MSAATSTASLRSLADKRALLAELLRRKAAVTTTAPASFGQERLWFQTQLAPGSPVFNVPGGQRVSAGLRAATLQQALATLAARHETLRTCLRPLDGVPVQEIVAEIETPLPVVDLGHLDPHRRAGEEDRLIDEVFGRPFDLTRRPLWRALLMRPSEAGQSFLLTVHHAIYDDGSAQVLQRELEAAYDAYAAGRPALLAPLAVQYADFARWQHRWLETETCARALGYWRRQLAGLPELELPADRTRPPVPSFRGRHCKRVVAAPRAAALTELAQRLGATPFMLHLTLFQILLGRFSGQPDFAVGAPVTGRQRAETEGLIGFFVNMMVLRADLRGNPVLRALLEGTRGVVSGALAHQALPFERLAAELEPRREAGRNPLFQAVFVLLTTGVGERDFLARGAISVEGLATVAKFDLSLKIAPLGGPLGIALEYATDLFDPTTAERMADGLGCLIDQLDDPDLPLAALSVLGPAARWQLLGEHNDTERAADREATVHELFTEQARRQPTAIALSFDGTTAEIGEIGEVSYGEFDRRANQLAHHLRALGTRPEELVGVCLERGPELIVALLAVLKAGGAYLPLEPGHPPERLAELLADAGVRRVVTETALAARLPVIEQVVVDEERAVIAALPTTSPASTLRPTSLCYVMYTSGSTGRPKGVATPHRGVVRLVRGADFARLDPETTFLHLAPAAFDASTLEIWGPLLNGGRVALAPPGQLSLEQVGAAIARHGVDSLWLTAGLFHRMVEERLDSLRGLRQLLAGGDVLSRPHVERVLEALPATRMVNGYGPTESTTFACCHRCVPAEPGRGVAIGRAIVNTWVSVVDRGLVLVPIGVVGELVIGGDGLARGYLGRPAATAERFVPDPFGAPGRRLYRTGDLGRRRYDGRIELRGRIDHQVKVRGHRVEPGEVEAVLGGCPGVRTAVVVARPEPGAPGEKRLVAYLVAEPTAHLDPVELRVHLASRLPEPMVPSAFVVLETLPLTPNGKLDRAALPDPDLGRAALTARRPRTPVEELVAGLLGETLGVSDVGLEADFFELGGHSLQAIQLVSRLRDAFGIELSLQEFFEAGTVRALAATVERALGAPVSAPPLLGTPHRGELPLSFGQQRLWFLDRLSPGSPVYNVPAALDLPAGLRPEVLERCLAEIVRRHEALRTTFGWSGSEPVQRIAAPPDLRLPVIDLERLGARSSIELGRQLGLGARQPFDLARDPMLRVALFRRPAGSSVLLVVLHHVASDGWSLQVLLEEIRQLYTAFAAGAPSPLPELPVQYGDYALWQRGWLHGETLERLLGFWRAQLGNPPPPALELPTDRPRPPVASLRGSMLELALSPALSAALERLARERRVTLFMLLAAGFKALLCRFSGQTDVTLGTPVAGRNRSELEGLIGFFVNTLVLRTDCGGDPPFGELVRRVRRVALAAFAHGELPFEKLVEDLAPERATSHTPLFQAMLVLQGTTAPRPTVATAAPGYRELHPGTAKFDLTLSLEPTQGGIAGFLEVASDLFDPTTARRLASALEGLLEAVVADPELRLGELPLLRPAQRHQLLVEHGHAGAGGARWDSTLARRFEHHGELRPDAVAVVDAGGALSYRALAERAHRLAHHLRALGVGLETPVALCLERGAELVIALLAVVEAGGAYVPLDPDYPAERLALLLADSGAHAVVTCAALAERLPASTALVVRIDTDAAAIAARPATPPAPRGEGANLVYLIYTSGSTGKPKGVAVPQRGVARLVCDTAWVHLDAAEVLLLLASISFDASAFEIWGALANGARLAVMPPGPLSLAELGGLIERERVSTLWLTAGLFHRLVESRPESLRGVRQLVAGGDALSPAHVRRVLAQLERGRVINGYGPTENSVFTCTGDVRSERDLATTVPIGRPLDGTSAFLTDPALRPVPMGVVGELVTGGEGLARGYFGRPALTAERFVPDPSGAPGTRLYRTGDRARALADGRLEFLGRADRQVKIRGFRIEPGEIEAVLAAHPRVAAVAVVVTTTGGERRLAAYVAGAGGAAPPSAELRAHLLARLPEFMVPAFFVELPELPLNAAGKVDRRALPAAMATMTATAARTGYRPPQSELERQVAAIWCRLLGLEQVGVDESFFELGGHSLAIARLQEELRTQLGVEVPLVRLFQYPTVAAQARLLHAAPPPPTHGERPADRRGSAARRRQLRQTTRSQDGREQPQDLT